jgi:hypothetical protein
MKLFKRLLSCTVLNTMIIFKQATGQNIDHLSYRVQLVEGLFNKCAQERSGAGRRALDNTLRKVRNRHFIRKVAPKSEKYREYLSEEALKCTCQITMDLCRLISRQMQHSPRLSQPCCVLHTALPCPGSARGGHFSKGLAGYNIGMFSNF